MRMVRARLMALLPRMRPDADRTALVAGVLDAGLSSLATFVVGVFAAFTFAPELLGGYALAFSAFAMAGILPQVTIFTPLEVLVVAHPRPARLRLIRHTIGTGLPVALVLAFAVSIWTLVAPAELPRDAVIAFTVTAIACAFLSPMQDHVRRMLHSAGASWLAVVVATVQLVSAAAGIALFHFSQLPLWWAPLGSLAGANLISLLVALGLVHARRGGVPVQPTWRWHDITRSGRWLLLVGMVPTATTFLIAACVAHLAGAAVLGYAETSRLAAQPLLVLTTGLSATMSPRMIAAAREKDRREARRLARQFAQLVVVASLMYAAVAGHAWIGNPLAWVLPKAYVISGLTAAIMLGVLVQALAFPGRYQLLGAKRERELAVIEVAGNAVRSGIGSMAGVLGAFVIPCGSLALCLTRFVAQRRLLRAYYAEAPPPRAPRPPLAPETVPAPAGPPLAMNAADRR